jgi:hypothetical protein
MLVNGVSAMVFASVEIDLHIGEFLFRDIVAQFFSIRGIDFVRERASAAILR